MLNKTLAAAALFGGIAGLAGPLSAQAVITGVGGAIGGDSIIGATPADNVPLSRGVVQDRYAGEDGTVVVYDRAPNADGTVAVTRRVIGPTGALIAGNLPREGTVSGGVGGAMGGRYIVGTTPADNAPYPGAVLAIR